MSDVIATRGMTGNGPSYATRGLETLLFDIPPGFSMARFGSQVYEIGPSGPQIMTGSVDPSAGAGVLAPIGSFFSRVNGAVGNLYFKTGPANTNWTLVV